MLATEGRGVGLLHLEQPDNCAALNEGSAPRLRREPAPGQ